MSMIGTHSFMLCLLLTAHDGASALRVDRISVLRSACVLSVSLPMQATRATEDARTALQQARAQLGPVEEQIADGNWDGVRNVIKTAPLANSKNLISAFISERGETAEDLVVTREDLVQSLAMLDMYPMQART